MEQISKSELVELITELTPLNNKFRMEKDPVEKVIIMWEFGKIVDKYLRTSQLKLHSLLKTIYDPHSTVKLTNITRDAGSYCYRIFNFFASPVQIAKQLHGLKKYTIFREAIPLLFNPAYKLKGREESIFSLITSNRDPKLVQNELKQIKQRIKPVKNPRNQKYNEHENERNYIRELKGVLDDFYHKHEKLPKPNVIDATFGMINRRETLVVILMALASDSFQKQVSDLDEKQVSDPDEKLLKIAKSNNQNRARFRKWTISTNELFKMAEAMHALSDENNYRYFRRKIEG